MASSNLAGLEGVRENVLHVVLVVLDQELTEKLSVSLIYRDEVISWVKGSVCDFF